MLKLQQVCRQQLLAPTRCACRAALLLRHCCRRGRQLVYELSTVHKRSLLLNFLIQRILQAGHEKEVASHGSNLSFYFEVYHRCARRGAARHHHPGRAASRDAQPCIDSAATHLAGCRTGRGL